uniref:Uncharacterized protein n=1 Tax=Glossina palpalis gambiensis TaxID=67801 RepID=A0A1B0AV61_9MUSC
MCFHFVFLLTHSFSPSLFLAFCISVSIKFTLITWILCLFNGYDSLFILIFFYTMYVFSYERVNKQIKYKYLNKRKQTL